MEPRVQQPWHLCAYGNPGVGKSPFAATLPKPMKVFFFEGLGKEWAYLEQGQATGLKETEGGGLFQGVLDSQGQLVIEIEYFADQMPHELGQRGALPSAYERYQASLMHHLGERWQGFQSVIFDSVTAFVNAVLAVEQYKFNPISNMGNKQDARQWHGAAKMAVQNHVIAPFVWAPIHSVVIAHVDSSKVDQQDKQLWGVNAPGTLRGDLPGAFPETYLVYEERGKAGWESRLMTRSDGVHIARSERRVPDGCLATWETLATGAGRKGV